MMHILKWIKSNFFIFFSFFFFFAFNKNDQYHFINGNNFLCVSLFFILSLFLALGKKYIQNSQKCTKTWQLNLLVIRIDFFFGFIRPDSHLTVSSVMFFSVIVVVVVSCLIRIKSLNLDQTKKTIFFSLQISLILSPVYGEKGALSILYNCDLEFSR